VQQDQDFNFDRLKLVGDRAVPFLIRALQDPRTATMTFGKGAPPLGPQSPFERICKLLEPMGPPAAAPALASYMSHQDEHFRMQAARALGNIGTVDCIQPMLKALADDNDYVRSLGMMGIEWSMKAKRCDKAFLAALFPAIAKLLNRPDSTVSGRPPALLLAIDANRALPILFSKEYFTVDNEEVRYIIRALNQAGQKIPHDRLLPLLKELKPLSDEYPHDYEYAAALIAYAHNPDSSAEQTFRAELHSPNEKVQEAAAQALGILNGVTDPGKVVFDTLNKKGFDGLSKPQKFYYGVCVYDGEVNNGGHAQYFVNSSGDFWKTALGGLQAIGAAERAKILQEAIHLFGPAGPSEDNDTRHEQLARFSRRQDKLLERLDDRYYSCEENVNVLLSLYTIDHKDDFTNAQK
jgi:hypothetical protein